MNELFLSIYLFNYKKKRKKRKKMNKWNEMSECSVSLYISFIIWWNLSLKNEQNIWPQARTRSHLFPLWTAPVPSKIIWLGAGPGSKTFDRERRPEAIYFHCKLLPFQIKSFDRGAKHLIRSETGEQKIWPGARLGIKTFDQERDQGVRKFDWDPGPGPIYFYCSTINDWHIWLGPGRWQQNIWPRAEPGSETFDRKQNLGAKHLTASGTWERNIWPWAEPGSKIFDHEQNLEVRHLTVSSILGLHRCAPLKALFFHILHP